jgi:hypothetical protein
MLNAVEGFFAKLTKRRLKRGVFGSAAELETAIEHFIAETDADPKPFVWTARPSRILAAVKRGKQALESFHWMPGAPTKRRPGRVRSRASKSKPSARWGGTGMRARGVWLQTMMWDCPVFPKVTGCRTPGVLQLH